MATLSPLDQFPDRPVLVTGAAGFIGYHLAERLLGEGRAVIGLDNLSTYYDVELKKRGSNGYARITTSASPIST